MKGADYIARFLAEIGASDVFLVTGGACAFIVDAIARRPDLRYACFQHEQAAAMAADAIWRVDGGIGVTVATSGPGATNLLTGIACSYFDSIPTLHITGQVNAREIAQYRGAQVRQAGFQETKIIDMARPVTKYATAVHDAESLRRELKTAVEQARSARMGPALVDIPMDVQQIDVGDTLELPDLRAPDAPAAELETVARQVNSFLASAKRPLVLFGAGVGLAGAGAALERWLEQHNVPFVASWNGMTYFDHALPSYLGHIGVYGNRGANFAVQNADAVLVLGSRLDNRQRSGNADAFARAARLLVVDVDREELRKYDPARYQTAPLDLVNLPALLQRLTPPPRANEWASYLADLKEKYYGRDISSFHRKNGTLSPYAAVQIASEYLDDDAVVAADCGANLCWVYQVFSRRGSQVLMTAGGHSPMGYSLPASIGAALRAPKRQQICFIGDGGLQVNIQDLQTIRQYGLDIKLVVLNNHGYGIIKQFQDSYLGSRYEATGKGYGVPDLAQLAALYGLDYARVSSPADLNEGLIRRPGARLIDVDLHPNTLIEPKLEMGRPINDQFPYMPDDEYAAGNRFATYPRP